LFVHVIKPLFHHRAEAVESDWFLVVAVRIVFPTLSTIIPSLFLVKFRDTKCLDIDGQRYRKNL